MGANSGWTSGRADGGPDGRTRWQMGGLADEQRGRTVSNGFPKNKTPQPMHQLKSPLEIQRGRPRVIVQTDNLLPPSR